MSFLGPVMISVSGVSLDKSDLNRLQHPAVGGVVIFSRNYVLALAHPDPFSRGVAGCSPI